MMLTNVHTLDDDALTGRVHREDLADGALVVASDDLDAVTLLDLERLHSDHLRGERDDAHELLLTQLAGDGAEDTGTTRLPVSLKEDGSILVELDVGPVRTTVRLDGPNDDGLDDLALLHVSAGDGILDGAHDGVTEVGVATLRSTENTDAKKLLRTSVVGDFKSRLLLDHVFSFVPLVPSRA
eukprot:TRINITY_DN59990_c0_g5_i1.p2 TRINITY_DN59990_c0_g5~~TRINITY_DN59990_c0_g5_i1.p2  ORF type:complete len:183 (-),score=35.90 TRINITY_DN59990_c0_g5_i1:486-1034(-)